MFIKKDLDKKTQNYINLDILSFKNNLLVFEENLKIAKDHNQKLLKLCSGKIYKFRLKYIYGHRKMSRI